MRVSRYWRLKEQTYRLQQENNTLLSRPEKVSTDVKDNVVIQKTEHKVTQAA